MPKETGGNLQPLEGKLLARVKAEYLRSRKSVRVLAAEFSVSESALERLVTRDKWKALREETAEKVAEKLVEKLATDQAQDAAAWVKESLRLAEEFRKKLAGLLVAPHTQIVVMPTGDGVKKVPLPLFNSLKDYQAFTKALGDVDKIGRLSHRLDLKAEDGGPGGRDPSGSAGDTDAFARGILESLDPPPAGE